jgi:hypothetical protein
MFNEASRFWREVQRNKRILLDELQRGLHPGNPPTETVVDPETGDTRNLFFVWAASRRNLAACTTEADARTGRGISCLPFDLFAQRFTEGSHTWASEAQIAEYQEYRRVQKIAYEAADSSRSHKFEIAVPTLPALATEKSTQ